MKKHIFILLFLAALVTNAMATKTLIPMDKSQKNHMKAYGIAYWALEKGIEVKWLLNYRGGSFLCNYSQAVEDECQLRGISRENIADGAASNILAEISSESQNMDAVTMQKAPKIAVYSPPNKQPWDDAVTMVLTYAQIPYDIVYDQEIIDGKLSEYDWLHLHHEDFTGQYGRFYQAYHNMPWYQKEVKTNEDVAHHNGFQKVSQLKLFVARTMRQFIDKGGFLFAMCAATDSYDIALSAQDTDICDVMYDGDGMHNHMNEHLDFSQTLAFQNFKVKENPLEYEFSDIDMTTKRSVRPDADYFTLFEFSAKWDPVPTMLTQNHTKLVRGFMGQTTSYDKTMLKSNVLILGENKSAGEVRYLHGELGKGFFTFYGGHDPEDYRHLVGDKPTDLNLHPNSPGYRLILNNILFPAAKKKKQKT